MIRWKLVLRNLLRNPLRSLLTMGALMVAFFLLITLRSLIVSLSAGVEAASTRRLIVQSAVSLFVDLPLSYGPKISAVPGVQAVSKYQWFGASVREGEPPFAQFAIDPEPFFEMYPEAVVIEGSREAFLARRNACLVGEDLMQKYGWKVGDTVPLTSEIFVRPDGGAWEFQIEAVYRADADNFDDRTLFFHWKFFEETLLTFPGAYVGVGTYAVLLEPGAQSTAVMAGIDQLFENGPQRVQATSESEFQAQFVSMFGSVPFFLTSIGGAVLAAILMACINTMLMAAREQTRDLGVIKALGFSDRAVAVWLLAQSMVLSLIGAGVGIGLAYLAAPAFARSIADFIPSYAVRTPTLILGVVLALVVGLVAGLAPAWMANRLEPVTAIRTTN